MVFSIDFFSLLIWIFISALYFHVKYWFLRMYISFLRDYTKDVIKTSINMEKSLKWNLNYVLTCSNEDRIKIVKSIKRNFCDTDNNEYYHNAHKGLSSFLSGLSHLFSWFIWKGKSGLFFTKKIPFFLKEILKSIRKIFTH